MTTLSPAEAQRFWSKVTRRGPDECWTWNRATGRGGYGSLTIRQKRHAAHRLSYEMRYGPIAKGLVLRHRCDNPPCVNPTHLTPGTDADNIHDCIERGRKVQVRGERIATAKLTASQVQEIRRLGDVRAASGRELARRFGVSHTEIQEILARRRWIHVPEAAG